MIPVADLRLISAARLDDARALLGAGRLDGAAYLCGYAVEIALKARICVTLGWTGFPETRREFENYVSFRTHNLDVLLTLSGVEANVKANHLAEWSAVAAWNPEARYKSVGLNHATDVQAMITSAEILMNIL